MAIAYCPLGSGSTGNALWLSGGGVQILVDCGLSLRSLGHRMQAVGLDLSLVQAVVLTHGHADHVGGAAALARRHGVRLYGTPETLRRIPGRPPAESLRPLPASGRISIGGLRVATTPTLHDAPGSVALRFEDDETGLGYATDLGFATRSVVRHLSGCDGVVIEFNHDEEMLLYGPYDERLKRRIYSEVGHLSNRQGAQLLDAVLSSTPRLRHVILAHLSLENNTPELARRAAEAVLARRRCRPQVAVADPQAPGPVVRLQPSRQMGLPLW